MSDAIPKSDTPIDGREIDLLVDGELSEPRRRELLVQLDKKPDGWRQCALAFLEDQSWRQSCAELQPGASPQPERSLDHAARQANGEIQYKRRPGAVAKAAGALLTVAASFLLLIGLGSMIFNVQRHVSSGAPGGAQQADILAGAHDATPADPSDGALIHGPTVFLPGKFQTVTITDNRADGKRRSIQLPAVAQNSIDETRLRETPSAIPPELVQAFQKAGHKVQQSRRLVPFRMKDGRRLVVPVDQLDVQYTQNPEYQ